jgi:hypothetical protein
VPDEKVKKEIRTIEVSPLLSIDSPMVVLTLEGDDEPVDTGTGGGGDEPPPPPKQPQHLVAVCRAQFHPPDMKGALPNGAWMGTDRERFEDALGDVQGHEDGGAFVFLSVGGVFIGPVTQQ